MLRMMPLLRRGARLGLGVGFALWCGLGLGLGGCSGKIDDGAAPPPDGTPPGMPPPGSTPPGTMPPGTPQVPCGVAPWRPTPLTREQYINSASDLLGFDVRPLATFADVGGRTLVAGVSLSGLQVEARMNT